MSTAVLPEGHELRTSPDPRLTDRPSRGARLLDRLLASRADLAIAVLYLTTAVYALSGQWRDTAHGYLVKSGQDQSMWEWFFAETAHAVIHLHNPLGTNLQNYPDGVNMMANTAMFGVGIPLTPVTVLFGPTVTFALVLTLGLAGTGFAWYWLFSRELVRSRFAAALGGAFCGFAPAMISHANAHPNFVGLALLPGLAILVVRMARRAASDDTVSRARQVREAVVLAVLVALQIALGEEPLLIFALGFGLFALVYYLHDPRTGLRVVRAVTPTLALAAVITVVVTAIPLWWQFFGPQSYRSIDHGPMGNDLEALVEFPSQSLGGVFAPGKTPAINPTEENAFFGWPLPATTVIVVFSVLSLGAGPAGTDRAAGDPSRSDAAILHRRHGRPLCRRRLGRDRAAADPARCPAAELAGRCPFPFPTRGRLFRRADGRQEGPLRSRRSADRDAVDAGAANRSDPAGRFRGEDASADRSRLLACRRGRPAAHRTRRGDPRDPRPAARQPGAGGRRCRRLGCARTAVMRPATSGPVAPVA
nr:DUF6541 family protein [Nocardia nova]